MTTTIPKKGMIIGSTTGCEVETAYKEKELDKHYESVSLGWWIATDCFDQRT